MSTATVTVGADVEWQMPDRDDVWLPARVLAIAGRHDVTIQLDPGGLLLVVDPAHLRPGGDQR